LGSSAYNSVYLHQAGRFEPVTGLYNFRNRDYSASLGRWMQLDPLGVQSADLNYYRYLSNRSLIFLDPFGLTTVIATRKRMKEKIKDLDAEVSDKPYAGMRDFAVKRFNKNDTRNLSLNLKDVDHAGKYATENPEYKENDGTVVPAGTYRAVCFLFF